MTGFFYPDGVDLSGHGGLKELQRVFDLLSSWNVDCRRLHAESNEIISQHLLQGDAFFVAWAFKLAVENDLELLEVFPPLW